jgi:hypothetical protein
MGLAALGDGEPASGLLTGAATEGAVPGGEEAAGVEEGVGVASGAQAQPGSSRTRARAARLTVSIRWDDQTDHHEGGERVGSDPKDPEGDNRDGHPGDHQRRDRDPGCDPAPDLHLA